MTTKSAVASSLIAVALMSGCATPFHDSWLIGERYYKTNLDTQPVIILGVDNQDTTQRRVLVEPGEHVIRVQATPTPGAPWAWDAVSERQRPRTHSSLAAVSSGGPNRKTQELPRPSRLARRSLRAWPDRPPPKPP